MRASRRMRGGSTLKESAIGRIDSSMRFSFSTTITAGRATRASSLGINCRPACVARYNRRQHEASRRRIAYACLSNYPRARTEIPGVCRRIGPRKGCRNDKAQCYQHRAESLMQGVGMLAFTLASCQIMPHDIVVVTGDINIDGLVIAVILAAWLIGKRR